MPAFVRRLTRSSPALVVGKSGRHYIPLKVLARRDDGGLNVIQARFVVNPTSCLSLHKTKLTDDP
jgi:hypothetical protein